jgi:hypothetical protein
MSSIYPQVCPWSDQSYLRLSCEMAAEGAGYGLASGRNENEAVETGVIEDTECKKAVLLVPEA